MLVVVQELLPTEWAVLGLLSRKPQHGFALAKSLSPDGEFGRIWTVRRPLVYRALDTLRADGLIEFQGVEPGDAGPPRRKTVITEQGRRLVLQWLEEPVRHLRETRALLLLKLAIIDELGLDPQPLLESQLALVKDFEAGLKAQLARARDGSERMVFVYRVEMAKALERFLVRSVVAHRAS
jgi:DNA-binding PadR family transcriptional regulator